MMVRSSLTPWEGKKPLCIFEARNDARYWQHHCARLPSPAPLPLDDDSDCHFARRDSPALCLQHLSQRLAQVYQISAASSQGRTLGSHPES